MSFDDIHPGFVKWENVAVGGSLQISLKFKTSSENGLIYHLVNSDGSPASTLKLKDGQLRLESQGVNVTTNPQDSKFNDDEWHVITTTHNGTTLRLDIDDVKEEIEENAPAPLLISNGSLYIGSLPGELGGASRYFHSFVGCIGDATLNGAIVNFANTTDRPWAHLGQCHSKDTGK